MFFKAYLGSTYDSFLNVLCGIILSSIRVHEVVSELRLLAQVGYMDVLRSCLFLFGVASLPTS